MKFFDDEQSSYVDYSGYRFLPGNSYPIDWFFYPAEIFGYHYPVSIHLGSTTAIKPLVKISGANFDPASVKLTGVYTSIGSVVISASPACSNDPNCLHAGDKAFVEIIKNTAGGAFTYDPPSQNKEITLNLGGDITANFTVNLTSTAGLSPPFPKPVGFTIRVADIRRDGASFPGTVQYDPPNQGVTKSLMVNP